MLSLLMQQDLLLFSSKMQLSQQATSLGGSGPKPDRSVVDYTIVSYAAAPQFTGVTVDNALPRLSNHCPLMWSLALPAPLATLAPALATLHAFWEPSAQVC